MEQLKVALNGVRLLKPAAFEDSRGNFIKTFHHPTLQEMGIHLDVREEFYSVSKKGVLRGMHFQVPPAAHAKMVYCTSGAVLDVVLDIRRDSPTFGKVHVEELSDANHHILFIPEGFAHGFLALSESALMIYKTNVVHTPEYDQGIRWDSFGFNWPLGDEVPIVSDRDASFPRWENFNSPFE